jgi:DNA-binding MurR/RpiR family transcriptional regulator
MTDLVLTLSQRLAACRNLSGTESALATWMERNLHALPFENAAAVAAGAGVSEMSVSRFVRRLGYDNFKALKADLKAQSQRGDCPELDDRLRRWALPPKSGEALDETLRREIEAIVDVYHLARQSVWRDALEVIVAAERVSVTGFQASKGLALDFATRLKWVRPGVRFVEGTSGTWSEIFEESGRPTCVVLVDTAAYAHTSFQIAELCLRQGLPLIIVTDRFSNWARKYSSLVLTVSTHTGTYWDSSAGLAALLGLLVNDVTARLGSEAKLRFEQMTALGEHFQAFAYDSDAQGRPMRSDGTAKGEEQKEST